MPVDEYEVMLDRVNQLTERRQTTTTTYISVNAALTGAIAFLFKDGNVSGVGSQISVLVLLFSGIVACGLWRRLITHYSTLTGWWYEQLRDTEDKQHLGLKVITKEYQDLFVDKRGKGPIGITRYETRLTWLFTVIYVVFGIVILMAIILANVWRH